MVTSILLFKYYFDINRELLNTISIKNSGRFTNFTMELLQIFIFIIMGFTWILSMTLSFMVIRYLRDHSQTALTGGFSTPSPFH